MLKAKSVSRIVFFAGLIFLCGFANAQGASASLADNMVLGSGDTIITGPNSTVDINLGVNGDVLRVEPDSTLKIDQLDVTRVSPDRKSTRLNSSHTDISRMPSSA